MRKLTGLLIAALLASAGPRVALAQKPKKGGGTAAPTVEADDAPKKKKKARVFEFGAFGIEGSMRTPALLYFLGRAKQELDRASLEKRSFMPELQDSVEEGGL